MNPTTTATDSAAETAPSAPAPSPGEILARLLAADAPAALPLPPLSADTAEAVVQGLKAEVDRHWLIDPNRSIALARAMEAIARARQDDRQLALARMATGDSLKLLGRLQDAWNALAEAGALYRRAGDDVGWARTRIGRLLISVDLNRTPQALADAAEARRIFRQAGEVEKALRLDINEGILHDQLGNHQQALALLRGALQTATAFGPAGEAYLGMLRLNIGSVLHYLGELEQARAEFAAARGAFAQRQEWSAVATADFNLGLVDIDGSRYRQALARLVELPDALARDWPVEAARAQYAITRCYLALNRPAEAARTGWAAVAALEKLDVAYELAWTLLATAEAEERLRNFDAAQAALARAQEIYTKLGVPIWAAVAQVRLGELAAHQQDWQTARAAAQDAVAVFARHRHPVNRADALLLLAEAELQGQAFDGAAKAARTALATARRRSVLDLRYRAHLLLGRVAEARGEERRAVRRYRAASAALDRIRAGLSLTLRSDFMADKSAALHGQMRLLLAAGRAEAAFHALERAKSQIFLGYLSNPSALRWQETPRSRQLQERLGHLRARHQQLYQRLHLPVPDGRDGRKSPASGADASGEAAELAGIEREMRAIHEQLFLTAGEAWHPARTPGLDEIRTRLAADERLLAFYSDGEQLWRFGLGQGRLDVRKLPASLGEISRLQDRLLLNVSHALHASARGQPLERLAGQFQRVAARLHQALLAEMPPARRLLIVAYGPLHFLPFHLLHNGQGYLIEAGEVVLLPSAGLMTRPAPARAPGARILTDSWAGRLPHTGQEGGLVRRLLGGELAGEGQAQRQQLRQPPRQVLHIAAHGEHRLDQPDLSYIHLADGPLFADDLMQADLSYELVVLSACESGRARVSASEELIGLSRGFLYAGAGAIVSSLWQVPDDTTFALMEQFYRALGRGASKAGALRMAQRAALAQRPGAHPALWGGFQLVGDGGPLSYGEIPEGEDK